LNNDLYPRLLGDVGGTNARFAWQAQADAPLSDVTGYRCADHATLQDAIALYLDGHHLGAPRGCGIAIANPITGDQVTMTNHHWSFSMSALQRALGAQRLVVVNDFTALALSLPYLEASALRPIGGGAGVPGAPLAVLGAGTGLGVSGLVRDAGGQWVPLTGEGGHVTLAAADEHEARVVELLRQRFGHASAERALSGPGLVNLYEAQATLLGRQPHGLSAAEIVSRARTDADATCRAAIELFCSFLGGVAGNLALTLGARGGVYIGGGIAPRLLPELEGSSFRARFEAKGRFQSFLAGIPTYVIDAAVSPAFLGASKALDRMA
jgi:glucokinase